MGVPVGFQRSDHQRLLPVRLLGALVGVAAAACTTHDPVYIAAVPPSVNTADLAMDEVPLLQLTLPMRVENAEQAAAREKLATELGLAATDVPSVRRDDVDVEIEWSIQNPGEDMVTARLAVVGANEIFRYDPEAFVDPEDEDAAPPPPLMGGKPIEVPPGATVTGVFREDDLAEASQDLDAFTRAGVNPGFALLTRWKTKAVSGGMDGALPEIPAKAVAQLLQMDLTVAADGPVILSAELRVRDRSDRLDINATDPATLVAPSATVFMPVFMTMP